MKTFAHALLALIVLASVSVAGIAQASPIASDLFSYSSGPLATNSGGTGWTGAWANAGPYGSATVIAGTGLTYTDNLGNTLVVAPNEVNTDAITQRNLAATITNSTVWASVLVDPTVVTNFSSWGLLFNNSLLGPNASSILLGRSGQDALLPDGNKYDVSNYSGLVRSASTVAYNIGTTALLVGEFQIASDNSVTATLFVNPTLSALTPTGGVSITQAGFGPLSSVQVFSYNDVSGTEIFNAADLRLGTTYADVTPFIVATPEPPAALLLGLAGVLSLGWNFARKQSWIAICRKAAAKA